MSDLTHINERGEAHVVDVGDKQATHRIAVATGRIHMSVGTLRTLAAGDLKKGDALATARIAGIMAAKRTAEVVPLCHPIPLTHVEVHLEPDEDAACVHCTVRTETRDRTGVEMEALNAVQAALLTVYDMCKALDRGMTIEGVGLSFKSGGRSGTWQREGDV
ncbi:cyclic pyranopterin monophosphate synthase MoaC [Arhodomonas sp. AD133]|uniref:cyclic pyranopterin monophosphate synthase MoaC n=1 Tax=Arhodomonas sp. AD133 TaxID=3415009 RepID=UPI003EBA6F69